MSAALHPPEPQPTAAPHRPARVILDTNVVLDWLLFRDPRVMALAAEVEAGALSWLATDAMLAEAERMLRHPSLARWPGDRDEALAQCRVLARRAAAPQSPGPGWPRCRDPDDQPFIELAIAEEARWLVSRDLAVLKLHRRLAAFGVKALTPERWASEG